MSPDGRWLLYQSNETGQWEVYVESFPGPAERIRVSLSGGVQPSWSRNGRDIFFRSNYALMAAPFDPSSATQVGKPRQLFDGVFTSNEVGARYYDSMPDGKHFVVITDPSSEGRREVRVVLNFVRELEERVPKK